MENYAMLLFGTMLLGLGCFYLGLAISNYFDSKRIMFYQKLLKQRGRIELLRKA